MNWDATAVRAYVAEAGLLGDGGLNVEEVGGGNLNLVFRVISAVDPQRSLILKQAPPYIKLLGPEYPLTQHRLAIEANALRLYDQLVPGSVPRPYRYDPEGHLILMEDLRGFRILRYVLMEGDVRPEVAASVGKFMAKVHSATHHQVLSEAEQAKYQSDFHNPEMHATTTDYVFTKPFREDPTNRHTPGLNAIVEAIRRDQPLLQQIDRLRERFMTAQEGVIHGDLHTGSIMVKGNDARVMDAEFAFYGPIAFDVGALIANYLLSWYAQSPAVRPKLLECVDRCWQQYSEHFALCDQLEAVWREAIQFAGVKMLRRILGAAHVQDIESIEDLELRRTVETEAIQRARTLILDPPAAARPSILA